MSWNVWSNSSSSNTQDPPGSRYVPGDDESISTTATAKSNLPLSPRQHHQQQATAAEMPLSPYRPTPGMAAQSQDSYHRRPTTPAPRDASVASAADPVLPRYHRSNHAAAQSQESSARNSGGRHPVSPSTTPSTKTVSSRTTSAKPSAVSPPTKNRKDASFVFSDTVIVENYEVCDENNKKEDTTTRPISTTAVFPGKTKKQEGQPRDPSIVSMVSLSSSLNPTDSFSNTPGVVSSLPSFLLDSDEEERSFAFGAPLPDYHHQQQHRKDPPDMMIPAPLKNEGRAVSLPHIYEASATANNKKDDDDNDDDPLYSQSVLLPGASTPWLSAPSSMRNNNNSSSINNNKNRKKNNNTNSNGDNNDRAMLPNSKQKGPKGNLPLPRWQNSSVLSERADYPRIESVEPDSLLSLKPPARKTAPPDNKNNGPLQPGRVQFAIRDDSIIPDQQYHDNSVVVDEESPKTLGDRDNDVDEDDEKDENYSQRLGLPQIKEDAATTTEPNDKINAPNDNNFSSISNHKRRRRTLLLVVSLAALAMVILGGVGVGVVFANQGRNNNSSPESMAPPSSAAPVPTPVQSITLPVDAPGIAPTPVQSTTLPVDAPVVAPTSPLQISPTSDPVSRPLTDSDQLPKNSSPSDFEVAPSAPTGIPIPLASTSEPTALTPIAVPITIAPTAVPIPLASTTVSTTLTPIAVPITLAPTAVPIPLAPGNGIGNIVTITGNDGSEEPIEN